MKVLNRGSPEEAKILLQLMSIYGNLKLQQVYKLFSGKEDVLKQLITRYVKHGRLTLDKQQDLLLFNTMQGQMKTNYHVIRCFWVLLDFIEKADNHIRSNFPVTISFFCKQKLYEIIDIELGCEAIFNQAFQYQKQGDQNDENIKRIIVIDSPEQIPNIKIPEVAGFCTVSDTGETNYYKLQ